MRLKRSGRFMVAIPIILILAAWLAGGTVTNPALANESALQDYLAGSAPALDMNEIAKMKIGVLMGSVHDTYLKTHYPNAQVYQYKTYPDLLLAVRTNKVDVGFMCTETLAQMQKDDKSLVTLIPDVFSVPIGIGFNKSNTPLRDQFNAFLKEIKANGTYEDMNRRWFQDGNFEMPIIANSKANGKVIIGMVSDKGMPFTSMKNNQLVGSDIELMERFAAYLGKEPVFSDMDFGSLIAAVSTRKVDMICSTIVITEERQKQIAFSDPYYELHAGIFTVRRDETAATGICAVFRSLADSFYRNIVLEDRYLLIVDGLKTTAVISLFSILLGTLLGALICWMRMSKYTALVLVARLYITFLRGIPVLVLLMLMFYVAFADINIDPVLVAIVSFGMNFGAYVCEMFRTSIESIDRGQTEAGIAGGFNRAQTFFYIVMPQAIRQVLPVYEGEMISLVKMTSIVGYIAVQDLTKASDIIRSRTFEAFFPLIMTAVLYFMISWLLILLLEWVQRRSDPKRRREAASSR